MLKRLYQKLKVSGWLPCSIDLLGRVTETFLDLKKFKVVLFTHFLSRVYLLFIFALKSQGLILIGFIKLEPHCYLLGAWQVKRFLQVWPLHFDLKVEVRLQLPSFLSIEPRTGDRLGA